MHLDHRTPALDKAAAALGSHVVEVDNLDHGPLEDPVVGHVHRRLLVALGEDRWVAPHVEVPVA